MKKKILYSVDIVCLFLSLAAAWATILMILNRVMGLGSSKLFDHMACLSAFLVLAALTITASTLFFHLKNHVDELYEEYVNPDF